MKIDAIDAFYLAMPKVTEEADGSQDALVMRVRCRRPYRMGGMRGIAAALDRRPGHVRCRMAPAAASLRWCSASGWKEPADTLRIAGRTSHYELLWICCRLPIPSQASRQRYGTFSGKARERAGLAASSAIGIILREARPMPLQPSAMKPQETGMGARLLAAGTPPP